MAVVRVIDRGLVAALERTSALAGSGVKVGYQKGHSRTPEGTDVLDVAIYTEYGTRTAVPRPFMHDAAVKYEHDMGLLMANAAKKVQNGALTQDNALAQLGEAYQKRIAAHIRSGEFAPNKPSTIKAKGSSVPLIDTGRVLIPGLRYDVLQGRARRSWMQRLLRIGK